MTTRPLSSLPGVATQLLLVGATLLLIPLLPPTQGAMLAMPLTGGSAAEAVNVALANGATVEGRARFGQGIVVRGARARLSVPMRARGFVLLAAASALCA